VNAAVAGMFVEQYVFTGDEYGVFEGKAADNEVQHTDEDEKTKDISEEEE